MSDDKDKQQPPVNPFATPGDAGVSEPVVPVVEAPEVKADVPPPPPPAAPQATPEVAVPSEPAPAAAVSEQPVGEQPDLTKMQAFSPTPPEEAGIKPDQITSPDQDPQMAPKVVTPPVVEAPEVKADVPPPPPPAAPQATPEVAVPSEPAPAAAVQQPEISVPPMPQEPVAPPTPPAAPPIPEPSPIPPQPATPSISESFSEPAPIPESIPAAPVADAVAIDPEQASDLALPEHEDAETGFMGELAPDDEPTFSDPLPSVHTKKKRGFSKKEKRKEKKNAKFSVSYDAEGNVADLENIQPSDVSTDADEVPDVVTSSARKTRRLNSLQIVFLLLLIGGAVGAGYFLMFADDDEGGYKSRIAKPSLPMRNDDSQEKRVPPPISGDELELLAEPVPEVNDPDVVEKVAPVVQQAVESEPEVAPKVEQEVAVVAPVREPKRSSANEVPQAKNAVQSANVVMPVLPFPIPEEKYDRQVLAGKLINKVGSNVVNIGPVAIQARKIRDANSVASTLQLDVWATRFLNIGENRGGTIELVINEVNTKSGNDVFYADDRMELMSKNRMVTMIPLSEGNMYGMRDVKLRGKMKLNNIANVRGNLIYRLPVNIRIKEYYNLMPGKEFNPAEYGGLAIKVHSDNRIRMSFPERLSQRVVGVIAYDGEGKAIDVAGSGSDSGGKKDKWVGFSKSGDIKAIQVLIADKMIERERPFTINLQ